MIMVRMFQLFKKIIPKKKTNMDKCYEYAVLALAYRRAAINCGEKEDGFIVRCVRTKNYVKIT